MSEIPRMAPDKLADKMNSMLSEMQELLAEGTTRLGKFVNADRHDMQWLDDFHAKLVAWSVDVRADAGSLRCVCNGPIGDDLELTFDALSEWCDVVKSISASAGPEDFSLGDESKLSLEGALRQLRGMTQVIRGAQANTSGTGPYAAMNARIEAMASAVHEASQGSSEVPAPILPMQYQTTLNEVIEALENGKDPQYLPASFWDAIGVKSNYDLVCERRAAREIETEGERRWPVATHGTPWPVQSCFKLCDYVWWYGGTRQATESQIIAIHDEAHAPKYQIRMSSSGDVVDNVAEGDLGGISKERHEIQRQRVTEAQEKERMQEDNKSFDR